MRLSGFLPWVLLISALACSRSGDYEKEPLDYIDTRIGTSVWEGPSNLSTPEEPMGFVYPGVGMPHAMIQLSPQTARTDRCYFAFQPTIQGFRASHYPNGTSMSEYGAFTITPTVGDSGERVHERESSYSHDSETAAPYYYSVDLERYGIKAELTGISAAGCLRFTYPASDNAHVVIDNPRSEYENYFHVIPERNEVEGYITNAGRVGNQGYTGREFACYYVASFNKTFDSFAIVPEPVFSDNEILFPGGFRCEFFNNDGCNGDPVFMTDAPDVNFEWQGSPAEGVQQDHFSVRCSGEFRAAKSGKHIFYVITDDLCRLFVNGEKVIDSKKAHRPFPDLYSINLQKGDTCRIIVEYTEKTGLATLRLACLEPDSHTEEQLAAMAVNGSVGSALRIDFKTKAGEKVEIKVGTSFIDFNQARRNLEEEIGNKSFDAVVSETRSSWKKEIGRIEVETTENNKRIFYTAMERISNTPRNLTEDGYHYSAFNGKIMPGIMYTDYSLWDTFRSLHPLLLILCPDEASKMITALLNSYDEGGWIPKWPSPGYSNIMHGTHGDAVISDAYVKGVRNFDVDKAFEAMMKDATIPGTGIYKARVGIKDFNRLGYVPADRFGESVERTMEFAYDDFCIAQVARGLGREDLYDSLMAASANYRNVFDTELGMVRGRNSDGSWRPPFDNAISGWAQGTERDCETYYRNISFFVPHNVADLANLMGGAEEMEKQLDWFFGNEFYYIGDEFSMHAPYLYNYIGRPWKTQRIIRQLVRDNFDTGFGGLPGNEDCGQLSSWYIFGVMGFYPVCPGTTVYQIGSPSFDKVTINLPDGKTFSVIANDNSLENIYIQSASLNGNPYDKCWIQHSDIMGGGTLVFNMGPEPNMDWGKM